MILLLIIMGLILHLISVAYYNYTIHNDMHISYILVYGQLNILTGQHKIVLFPARV